MIRDRGKKNIFISPDAGNDILERGSYGPECGRHYVCGFISI